MTNEQALYLLHKMQVAMLILTHNLDNLALKEIHHMPIDPTIANAIAQLDAATTAVAARLQKLIDEASSAGSLSAAAIVAALQPEIDRLTALGADAANPVPA